MGKLGKKARKFAKKNLQSVLRRKRKVKSMFKKKASKRDERDAAENEEEDTPKLSNRRNEVVDGEDASLDAIFSEDDSDVDGDDSGSDGYLSEDSSSKFVAESHLEETSAGTELSAQNLETLVELENKIKKLDRLKAKDPEFSSFLESHDKGLKPFGNEDAYSDNDEISDDEMRSVDENGLNSYKNKLTSSAISSWCHLVKEQHSVPALVSLLNGYRAACHYGAESTNVLDADSSSRIQDSEAFCQILTFMLHEADNVFRGMLGISSSNNKRAAILELKNTAKWKNLRPLVKSYLRSTLFMLNQATDSEILAFSLSRLRASIVFFAAFPSLQHRLIKIGVHLWATGEGTLSSNSNLLLQEVALVLSSDCFDMCLIKMYKAFIGHCKFVEPVLFSHIQFLRISLVQLCSQDLQNSSSKAMISVQKLARVLQLGLRTKKKEAVKNLCSWQFTNIIDLWVTYISLNIRDYDLHPLLYIIIQIINGLAILFPGPRYLPIRRKCIEWLNQLSSSSGVFIPVTSLVLDVLEYKIGKEGRKPEVEFNLSSTVKLPKRWLKSRNFQEECVFSSIELLSAHFAQWSYHISFPELATIVLIRLRKFHEKTAIESFRRVVKRFIDLVEQNIEFVRKKRDEVAFSPKDQQSVETFLQLEKCSSNAPFTQYYKSVMERAASRSLILNEKISLLSRRN